MGVCRAAAAGQRAMTLPFVQPMAGSSVIASGNAVGMLPGIYTVAAARGRFLDPAWTRSRPMSAPLLVIARAARAGICSRAERWPKSCCPRLAGKACRRTRAGARYTSGFPTRSRSSQVSSATFAARWAHGEAMAPFPNYGRCDWRPSLGCWRDKPMWLFGFGGYPSIPRLARHGCCETTHDP